MKCEKAKKACPGFRDLTDVIFRDESDRIIRKARTLRHNEEGDAMHIVSPGSVGTAIGSESMILPHSDVCPVEIPTPLVISESVKEHAVRFFFANYSCNKPPLSEGYHAWLTKMYFEDDSNTAIGSAIEAAGMAGLSNVFYAPEISAKSRELYGQAIAATTEALIDPTSAVADTTLMAVILLGLFEVGFETCPSALVELQLTSASS